MGVISMKARFVIFFCNLLTKPKKLVRLIVLLICTVVVVFQLNECFAKLRHPPITTHSRFKLNETVSYPAVTFCRDPPYNATILKQYGLSYHPRFTSKWKQFPFDQISVEDVFWMSTYDADDYFRQYSLNVKPDNVDIVSSIHFNLGQCQTIVPRVSTVGSWKSYGYSLILHHTISKLSETTSTIPPGWHLFIHEPKENFTENNMQTSGRVEYMYINVNEEIEIKLNAQHFKMIASRDNKCSNDDLHSAVQCEERCFWRQSTESVQCRGPWMPGINLPLCNNYTSMRNLIINYQNLTAFNKTECDCYEPCNSIIYSSFVMNRGPFLDQPVPSSQIWLYYTSKMVTVIEERPGYDGTQFLADIGGSLGFLLGLSVLGFIGILEKMIVLILSACAYTGSSNNRHEINTDESVTKPGSDQCSVAFNPESNKNRF